MKNNYPGCGGAETPKPIPGDFGPKGEPDKLNTKGAGQMSGDEDEPGKALAEFAGLGKGTKSDSIKGHGKAKLTAEGGPGGGYTTKF